MAPPTITAKPDFDHGEDSSDWANDGERDDRRFISEGTNKKLLIVDLAGDATNCKALEAEGRVTIRTVYSPACLAGAPYDSGHIDEQCDDPRFEGPGAAKVLLDSDLKHDSADCQALYEAGTIILIWEAE